MVEQVNSTQAREIASSPPTVKAVFTVERSGLWDVSWRTHEDEIFESFLDPASDDLDQWLEETGCEWSTEQRRYLKEQVWPAKPRRQVVVGNRQFDDLLDDALARLAEHNDPPVLFVRGGCLAHVGHDEDKRLSINPVSRAKMFERLSQVATWVRLGQNGQPIDAKPDNDVVKVLIDKRDGYPFPPLRGITEAPVLRSDGTILQKAGYDERTGLFYKPAPGLRVDVSLAPRAEEVEAGLRLLDEMVSEFPFVDRASKVNAFALMLTPILRPLIDGPVPLAVIRSPLPGSGKSLLTSSIAYTATGRWEGFASVPRQDENEWRKQLTSQLMRGNTFIIYDNVTHPLDSGELAKALTARVWQDRVLGVSRAIDIPVRVTWVATGNNLRLSREISRRSYYIEIDAKMDRPELRTFKRQLETWVPQRRGELLTALLTLGKAWVDAGRPSYGVPPLGSYDGWTYVVGNVLAHAGVEGFLGNRELVFTDVEDDVDEWEPFIERCAHVFGTQDSFSASDVVANIGRFTDVLPPGYEVFDQSLKRKLGYGLRDQRGVTYGNRLRLERVGKKREVRWRVIATSATA